MYEVDSRDRVLPLATVPQSDVGAPMPAVAAAEHHLELAYITQATADQLEKIAVVRFERPYAHFFGPPNDEAFEGHPLATRGLAPYAAFRIEDSSWLRSLERMNAVHPHHRPEEFDARSHFVLSFHDTTFECIAEGLSVTIRPSDEPLRLTVQVQP